MAHAQGPGLMDMLIGDVLKHIKLQLDWRGPTGRAQGHIVLTREQAEVLVQLPRLLNLAANEAAEEIAETFVRLQD